MKHNISFLFLIFIVMSQGCFAPVNSVFDSAKMLDKGEVEVQANYSKYYEEDITDNVNNNLGVSLGYGLSNTFNLKLRYERLHVLEYTNYWSGSIEDSYNVHYVELNNKFQLKKDKIAFSFPLGLYINDGESFLSFDPRFIFTFSNNDQFELNLIPKAHFLFYEEPDIMPGISLGFAFSEDLNKWAIRPEIGYDSYFTVGLGVNFYFPIN